MVKIRYAELPAGLHVATEDRGNCTVVYLLPGLTPAQRRAALTFARRSARIGHGPQLPAVDMAFALAADRTRTSAGTVVAALRRHPMLLLPLVALVSGVIVAAMLAFVTVSITPAKYPATDPPPQRAAGPSTGAAGSSSATPNPVTVPAKVPQLPATSHDGAGTTEAPDTPWSDGPPRQQTPGRLCFRIRQTTICLKS
ncbi:MAG TPA: hypothetical protein VEJ42_07245 [Streptosporangiaceae bacterium]|nr:hypothetical protein [Streptosporangiaceae bacterium]